MFTFHVDPGHGWLEVTPADLRAVGLCYLDFSKYSYRNHSGTVFYLEEDCDASKFMAAYRKVYGRDPQFQEKYSHRSHVRNYPKIHLLDTNIPAF